MSNYVIAELLTQNSSDKTYSFGRGLGKTIDDPTKFLSKLRAKIENSKIGKISLIPIRGFISGWNEVDPDGVGKFLDEALEDEVWSRWFVELQVQGAIDDRAFERQQRGVAWLQPKTVCTQFVAQVLIEFVVLRRLKTPIDRRLDRVVRLTG